MCIRDRQEASQREMDRHRRIAEGAILTRMKRARTDAETEKDSRIAQKQVNNLLSVAGISKPRAKGIIPGGGANAVDFGNAVTLIADGLIVPGKASEALVTIASETAKSARPLGVLQAIAAACALLNAATEAIGAAVFLLHHSNTQEKVAIYKVTETGEAMASRPGVLLESSMRRVFIVRENNATAELVACDFC